ncbi:UDP-diphosphatase [Longimonas halophila]|uniref:Undecaprenyl-diphosphatase n=1 Tax=Longimonas halophila TaxID=1469170 RepID=A0A2H3NXL7_9BACT|nr:undecaprenyl-diphosphate phosphatase [Longimonas halophila]PEN06993.1 UDP-diphosphatase [Longimonas halophila]
MNWWEAALLGLVQGLTEFLPVSSSGHLVLGQHVLGIEEAGITFEVFVHFGTVLSILTVYGRDVLDLLREAGSALAAPAEIPERYAENDTFRLGVFILITLIPTGLVYVLFKEPLEAAFGDPRLASGMLFVTGVLLLLTLLRPNPKGRLSSLKAFVVGIAQSAAMIPGISRSGSTICVALYQNVKPEQAANFSFLMLLPVVLGATLLKGLELVEQGATVAWLPLLLGTLIAYASGVVAIKLMIDFVKRGNLQYFAYYCFLIGGLGLWLL